MAMKCPKCGEEFAVRPSKGSSLSIWLVATIIIVVMLVAVFFSTSLLMSALKPTPSLAGDLTASYYDLYSGRMSLSWWVQLSGTVHNYGDKGCFATLNYVINGAGGWRTNGSVNLGWVSGDGGVVSVNKRFEGGFWENSTLPNPDTLKLMYDLNYTEP
jgi:hypothetical protein